MVNIALPLSTSQRGRWLARILCAAVLALGSLAGIPRAGAQAATPIAGSLRLSSWTAPVFLAADVNYACAAADEEGRMTIVWTRSGETLLHYLVIGGEAGTIPSPAGTPAAPQLAADAWGNLHLVWDDNSYVYYACRGEEGWSQAVALPKQTRLAYEARLALDENGQPHVLFGGGEQVGDYRTFYTCLEAGQWRAAIDVSEVLPATARFAFAAHGGALHLGLLYMRDDGRRSLAYRCSADGGATWSEREDVAGATAPVALDTPALLFWRGEPLLAWTAQDANTYQYDAFFAARQAGTWQAPSPLIPEAGDQKNLVLALDDSDHVWVTWLANAPGFVQMVGLGRADLTQREPADQGAFAWRGLGTDLRLAASASGASIVLWLTADRVLFYTYLTAFRPSSAVQGLPEAVPGPGIEVSWSGRDRSGAGLAGFDVQYRDGDGPWRDWFAGTSLTTATFPGWGGHTYQFRCRAVDLAGNTEGWPLAGDARTTLLTGPTIQRSYLPLLFPSERDVGQAARGQDHDRKTTTSNLPVGERAPVGAAGS